MKRVISLLFLGWLFFLPCCSVSASNEADSLERVLPGLSRYEKLNALERLSVIYGRSNPAKALKYDSLALSIHLEENNVRGISNAYNNIGLGLYALGDYVSALNFFKESFLLKEKIGDTVEIVKSLNNMGVVYQLVGDYNEAANVLMRSLQIRRKLQDTLGIARTLNNLSVLQKQSGRTAESIELLKEAEEIYGLMNDSAGLASVFNNYGTVYQLLQDWDLALKYFNLSIAYKSGRKDDRTLANTLNNIGMVLQSTGKYNEARSYYQKVVSMRQVVADRHGLVSVYINLGSLLSELRHYDSAHYFYAEAIAIATHEKLYPMLQRVWYLQSELFMQQNNYQEAYNSLQFSYGFRDSVFDTQYASKMAEMEARLRLDKTMKENTILKLQQQVDKLRIQRGMIWIAVISFIFVSAMIFAFVLYRQLKTKKSINLKLSEANKLLEESEEKYKAVVEQSNEAVFIHWNRTVLFVNTYLEQMMAYPKDKLYMMHPEDMFYGPDKNRFITIEEEDPELQERHELRLVTAQGRISWVSLGQKKILLFGEPAWLCVAQDITDRKETASLVRKLELAVRQSPVSITITDADGHIEFVNQQFTRLSGYSQEEVIGRKPSILKSGKTNPELYRKMWETISSGNIWYGELLNKAKDGSYYWISASISPILDENQIITHYLSVKEDITHRKAAEQQLLENQAKLHEANATKDKFFSIIAHDLKNPFNAIIGFSQLLLSEEENLDKEEKLEYIRNIFTASHNTYRLLENLLEWARTQTGAISFSPDYFDISMAIGQVMETIAINAARKRIELVSDVPFNTTVFADFQMIMGVLRNLISNAVKFTPGGGSVRVSHRSETNKVIVTVTDTGIGIPANKIDGLFRVDHQFRREGTDSEPGTGLGLILCQEFVTKNGGEIWVESKTESESSGSIFYFSLPVGPNM